MFPGQFTLCLNAKDVPAMRRFYETLGFKVHIDSESNVLLNNGDVDIALMNFLDAPCLNFRGADVFELNKVATSAMADLKFSEPERYKKEKYDATADGMNWNGFDPDGNNVFFDTNDKEMGEKGRSLALQRVLDATAKQLINFGATQECRDVFRSTIQDKFMPPERRATMDNGFDTSPLIDPGQYAGNLRLCLNTRNTEVARSFYEAIGLHAVGNNDERWVEIGNGDCQLDLMSFIDENCLNFRGADPFELYDRLKAAGFDLEGEPEKYTTGEPGGSTPGAHWMTRDPDENLVFFDTSDPELIVPGSADAIKYVLEKALGQLEEIQADRECIDAFKSEVMQNFMESSS